MYESFFGLSGKPFQLNPDPDFFFGSKGHRRALAYLEYGLHKGEGFIVITGEVGAGKTTLLQGLLRRLPDESIVAAQIVSTQVEADDLLRLVAAGFGLPAAGLDKAVLLNRLQEHLTGLHADGRRALLVVDEAQNLSPRAVEELRMLSNFQVGNQSMVQSFLVGQPEFRSVMQRPEMRQLKQRVIASYHLGPLDRHETQSYVEHRLRHVGWRDDPHFEPSAYDRIFAATGGVPRRINALCDRVMLGAYLGEQHVVSASDVEQVASELSDELGQGSVPLVPSAAEAARHAAPAAPHPNGTHAAPSPAQALAQSLASEKVLELERRIASLEASSNMMYGMLKKVLDLLRASRKQDVRVD
jgi:general secretion pathway protein A